MCYMDTSDLLLGLHGLHGCAQDKNASRGSWDLQRNVGLRGQNMEVRVTMVSRSERHCWSQLTSQLEQENVT